ncbi:transketolase [Streptomyces coeruleorubidus]|uniref:Transketolase n=1 Tax=Streptomyces coeruleorubidus TaxID=116188 RepID=A0ABZ0KMJ8_STRC4|nr:MULTISPECIES: transketolase [Streptomyces]WOT39118.1 transketolase [Streptomyces coeruleorubidus]GGU14696.1 transketolase [Streptomyces bellus]
MVLAPVPSATARLAGLRHELRAAPPAERAARLRELAYSIRRSDLEMISRAGQGHIGGDFSAADIVTVLYFAVLDVRPEEPEWAERDRFVLSKGHAAGILYSALSHAGFFPEAELTTFMEPLSPLNGHPNRRKVPGVETNTGPLGHGFPVAVGMAVAAKLDGSHRRTCVLTGDGELQEGSNWEAAMSASQQRLGRLTVIVDRNRFQQGAATEETSGLDPLDAKWASFGFDVRTVDGHDYEALYQALSEERSLDDRPLCLIADTIKGKGVSFIEDRVEWHHKVPTAEQTAAAFEELTAR